MDKNYLSIVEVLRKPHTNIRTDRQTRADVDTRWRNTRCRCCEFSFIHHHSPEQSNHLTTKYWSLIESCRTEGYGSSVDIIFCPWPQLPRNQKTLTHVLGIFPFLCTPYSPPPSTNTLKGAQQWNLPMSFPIMSFGNYRASSAASCIVLEEYFQILRPPPHLPHPLWAL